MRTMLVTVLLLVGCAASTQQGPGTAPRSGAAPGAGAGDDVQCQDEVPTGTLHHRTVCRDQFERDGEKKNAEVWMKTPRANPPGRM